jgi:transcriptional regulator with XRE-family HTH domain
VPSNLGPHESSVSALGSRIRSYRIHLDPQVLRLGRMLRGIDRVGGEVRDAEVAAAVGISLRSYSMIEAGRIKYPSPVLIARIASTLCLSDAESEKLVKDAYLLAHDQLLTPSSRAMSESVGSLGTFARRLWAASSEREIVNLIAETVSWHFRDADLVGVICRINSGVWEYPAVLGPESVQDRLAEAEFELVQCLTPVEIEETKLHGVFSGPGQVGDRYELHRGLRTRRAINCAFAHVGFENANFLCAPVRSSADFEAIIFTNYVNRITAFSPLERELLAAISEMSSLALKS